MIASGSAAAEAPPISDDGECAPSLARASKPDSTRETVMKNWRKFALMAILLIPVVSTTTGCEVDADTDDDGASIKVDTD
jgi:hypothetical protein